MRTPTEKQGRTRKERSQGLPREARTLFPTLSAPLWTPSMPPLLPEDKKPGPSVPGFTLQGAAEGGFESLEQARTHSTQTHSGRWGTHT